MKLLKCSLIKFLIIWVKSNTDQNVSKRKITSIKLVSGNCAYFDHTGWELNVLIPMESSILKECGITVIRDPNIYIYPFVDDTHKRGVDFSKNSDSRLIIEFNQYIDASNDTIHLFAINNNCLIYFNGVVSLFF